MTTASDLVGLANELAVAPTWAGNLRKIGSWVTDGVAAMQAGVAALAGMPAYANLVALANQVIVDLQDARTRVGNQPRLVLYVAQAPTVQALAYAQLAGAAMTTFLANVTAAGGTISDARFLLLTVTVGRLIDAGIWPLLDDLWIARAENTAQLRCGLKASCPAGTLVNSPVLVADNAITFDGVASRWQSGFFPTTHHTAMTPTNVMCGGWSGAGTAQPGFLIGGGDTATARLSLKPRVSPSTINAQVNSGNSALINASAGLGFFAAARNDALSGNVTLRIDGKTRGSPAQVTPNATFITREIYFGCLNNNGAATSFWSGPALAFVLGAMLADDQALALYQILRDHMTAIAPSVPVSPLLFAGPRSPSDPNVMLLDAAQADAVRGPSSVTDAAALDPVSLTDGRFYLGEIVARDPSHAEHADVFAACPVVPYSTISDLVTAVEE